MDRSRERAADVTLAGVRTPDEAIAKVVSHHGADTRWADFGAPQNRRRLFIVGDQCAPPAIVKPRKSAPKPARSILAPAGRYEAMPVYNGYRAANTIKRVELGVSQLGGKGDSSSSTMVRIEPAVGRHSIGRFVRLRRWTASGSCNQATSRRSACYKWRN